MKNHELLAMYKSIDDTQKLIVAEIRERNIHWMHLAEYGLIAQSMITYRNQFKCTVLEAKHAVESFLNA